MKNFNRALLLEKFPLFSIFAKSVVLVWIRNGALGWLYLISERRATPVLANIVPIQNNIVGRYG